MKILQNRTNIYKCVGSTVCWITLGFPVASWMVLVSSTTWKSRATSPFVSRSSVPSASSVLTGVALRDVLSKTSSSSDGGQSAMCGNIWGVCRVSSFTATCANRYRLKRSLRHVSVYSNAINESESFKFIEKYWLLFFQNLPPGWRAFRFFRPRLLFGRFPRRDWRSANLGKGRLLRSFV